MGAPVYLVTANQGYYISPDTDVAIGQFEPQVIPSGGFTSSSLSGTFYMGTAEVVNQAVNTGVAVETLSDGSFTITSDYTATYGQTPDQTETGTMETVNSNGTFGTQSSGAIGGIVISSTQVVIIDNSGQAYPTILAMKQ
jgi:hypothetical protein